MIIGNLFMKVNENYKLVKWQVIFNLVLENDDICIRNFLSNKVVGCLMEFVMFIFQISLLQVIIRKKLQKFDFFLVDFSFNFFYYFILKNGSILFMIVFIMFIVKQFQNLYF